MAAVIMVPPQPLATPPPRSCGIEITMRCDHVARIVFLILGCTSYVGAGLVIGLTKTPANSAFLFLFGSVFLTASCVNCKECFRR